MASDLERTVSIIFQGVDNSAKAMSGVSKNLDSLSRKVGDLTGPLAGVAEKFEIMGAGIATALGVGVGAAISATSKFDGAFGEIVTLIDAPIGKVGEFRDAVLDYAKNSTQPLNTVTDALYNAISGGVPYADAIDTIRVAEELAVAGRGDFGSTTETLIGLLNAYGKEASDAGEYSDTLFKTVAIGQTTLSDMNGKLGPLVALAATAGIPFDELAGAIADLTAKGMPTAQAIDGIKGAISNIIKPSEQAKKEAQELGLAFGAQNLAAKGLPVMMAEISRATKDNIEPTSKLFGDVNGLATALSLSKDGAATYNTAMDKIKDANGIVTKNFEVMRGEIENIHQNLGNNITISLIGIGSQIAEKYGDVVSGLSDVFGSIDFGDPNMKPLFDIINQMADDMAETLGDVAKNLPEALSNIDWSKVEKSFGNLSDMFDGAMDAIFGADVDLSSAEGLTTAIQGIVDAFAGIGNVIAGIGDAWTPFISMLADGLRSAADSDEGAQELVGNILGLGQAINVIAGLGSGAAGVLGGLAGVLSTLVNLKLASLITNVDGLGKGLGILKGLGAIAVPVTVSIIGGKLLADLVYSQIPGLEELDKKAFKATVDMGGSLYDFLIGNAIDAVGDAGEAVGRVLGDGIMKAFGQEPIIVTPEADLKKIQSDWDSITNEIENSNIRMPPVETDFDSIQSDWDSIVDEIENSDIRMPTPELEFDSADLERDIDELRDGLGDLDLPVDIDDRDLDKAKKKIKKSFTKAEMGPVGIDLDFGGNGTGPADQFRSSLENMEPVDMSDVIDLSGVAEMFEAIQSIDDPFQRRKAMEEALKIQAAQRKLMEEEARNLRVRANIAAEEARTAQIMWQTGEQENIIKIDAHGVEPEIEAFMFKILKKIQLRANEEGAEFLLSAAS